MIESEVNTTSGAVTSDTANLIEAGTQHKWYHAFRSRRSIPTSLETVDENPDGTLGTTNGVIVPVCLSMFR